MAVTTPRREVVLRTAQSVGRKLISRKGLLVLGLAVWGLASCARRSNYTVDSRPNPGWPKANVQFYEKRFPLLRVAHPQVADAEFVGDDQLCMTCHETYVKTFAHNVHRGQKCEDCHGPGSRHLISRGQEPGLILSFKRLPAAERSEICLKCHEQNQCAPGSRWRTSVHAHHGVSCTDCHTSHYNVPPNTPPTVVARNNSPQHMHQAVAYYQEQMATADQNTIRAASNHMGAISPQVCYRCHGAMQQFEQVAHPHQIGGVHGFTCATCHDPHGKIRQETRTDLCLQCHQGAPTAAYHSSVHFAHGVACTDCHNPHPHTFPSQVVNIGHTSVTRPKRLPMSVDEPNVCFKCHPKVYAQTGMPSHHPIKEGKLVCSDCHDGHGQAHGNLKEATVNQVCYRCHAEKQGPFVYEHPPVTENCMICHEPHGTVANNLLRQPATFLCLRCHSGHRTGPTFGPHTGAGLTDVGTDPAQQRAFFSDCTECHSQVHGSDLPSPHVPHALVR